jgi:RimJ/RimL family protein N-acetyltransferase
VIRGNQENKGLMEAACRSLIESSVKEYKLLNFYLKVFSDNQRAIKLYERLGFEEIQRVPLIKKKSNNGTTSWIQYMTPDYVEINRYFVTMRLK